MQPEQGTIPPRTGETVFSPRTKAVTTAWRQMIDFYLGGWGKSDKAVFEQWQSPQHGLGV